MSCAYAPLPANANYCPACGTFAPQQALIHNPALAGLKINQSQMNMAMRCGEQYRRRYGPTPEIIPPSLPLVRGSAVHKAAQVNFTQKIASRRDLPARDIVDAALADFEQRVKTEGVELSEEERGMGKDVALNKTQNVVRSLTALYANVVAPDYQPIAVEERMEVVLPSGITLYGTPDVIAEGRVIPDIKTTEKKVDPAEYEHNLQVNMYALLYAVTTKRYPKAVHIENLVQRANDAERQQIVLHPGRAEAEALLNQADRIARAIASNALMPSYGLKSAWWCSPKFCGYWSTCPFVPATKR